MAALVVLSTLLCGGPATADEPSLASALGAISRGSAPREIKPYGKPAFETTGGALVVSGHDMPSGVQLEYELDPGKRYRMQVEGHPRQGAASLRIRGDAQDPSYDPAPNGILERSVSGVHNLQLLLYGDRAFSYQVDSVHIDECAQCYTAKELQGLFLHRGNTGMKVPVDRSGLSQVQRFGSALFELARGALVVSSSAPPGGLKLEYHLDPEKRYRLQVTGKPTVATATVRVQRDDREPEYNSAPDGTYSSMVLGVRRIRLLLYGDAPFKYRLDSVAIAPCPGCKTDEDLRKLILAEVPTLTATLGKSRLDAARLLLTWSANASDGALSKSLLEHTHTRVSQMSASQMYYDVFLPNQGAVLCGDHSLFFDRVAKLFGYHSFTINFGDPRGDVTHVSVVIAENVAGTWQFFMFDPTFNATFRYRSNGKYATVTDMLDLVASGHADEIVVQAESLDRRDWIASRDPADRLPTGDHECGVAVEERLHLKTTGSGNARTPPARNGEWLVYTWSDYSLETLLAPFSNPMAAYGYPRGLAGFVQLLRHRLFSIGPCAAPKAIELFREEMKRRGVPVGSGD